MKLAAWLRVSGQFDDAAKLLDLIEQESGESATLLDERAALALAMGDAAAVRTCWERRLASSSRPERPRRFRSRAPGVGRIGEAAADRGRTPRGAWRARHGSVPGRRGRTPAGRSRHRARSLVGATREDPSRIAPLLAMARIALLGGDLDEARSTLSRALADPARLDRGPIGVRLGTGGASGAARPSPVATTAIRQAGSRACRRACRRDRYRPRSHRGVHLQRPTCRTRRHGASPSRT